MTEEKKTETEDKKIQGEVKEDKVVRRLEDLMKSKDPKIEETKRTEDNLKEIKEVSPKETQNMILDMMEGGILRMILGMNPDMIQDMNLDMILVVMTDKEIEVD